MNRTKNTRYTADMYVSNKFTKFEMKFKKNTNMDIVQTIGKARKGFRCQPIGYMKLITK